MYDTIIIGAGMSGLAAGIRLAHYDRSVCVLERHYTIGGLNSFYRLRGRDYDVGLHAVTGIPFASIVLAFSPGGLTEMSLVALALNVDTAFVATHHIVRITVVVMLVPFLFRLMRARSLID